jgi:hypothetical protein
MTGAERLERTTFSVSRAADVLDVRALQAQTGQPRERFGDVVVKELSDNALDAAETAGVAPDVVFSEKLADDIRLVTVTDNGPGLPAEVIGQILDFTVLVSDKSAYRSPTRGLQGNAWKTIAGIPYALGVTEPITVEALGVRHEIAVSLDPARNVVVRHEHTPCERLPGTSVTVPLPADVEVSVGNWAAEFAVVNPHATVTYRGNDDEPDEVVSYKPQVSASWRKPVPTDPLVPGWYDHAAFTRLVFSHIGAARNGGRDLPVGEFIRSFAGLSSTAKAKSVKNAVPGIETLSDFAGQEDQLGPLLLAMKAQSRPPKPAALGYVPEEHYLACLDAWFGVEEFWFRRKALTDRRGIPWVLEVAVAVTGSPGDVTYAVNYSPSFGDPLGGTQLSAGKVYATGAASFLTASDAYPEEGYSNDGLRAAIIHIITPAAEFTDKGKVRLEVPRDVAGEFAATITAATKVLREDAKRRERDAAKADRQVERRQKADKPAEPTIKEAVCEVIPAAVSEQQGGSDLPFSARDLYYKVRPLVQRLHGKNIDDSYAYFTQQLLPEYQREHGPIRGLYYDPRGELHEPHDPAGHRSVRIGTREVASYRPPEWTYNKILYVEKEGLWPVLEAARPADRYDMAIVMGKGFAVEACRALLASMPAGDVRIFALHDADPAGYNIAITLGEATRRMPDHHVEVTDLGLTIADAVALGLQAETFTRKKALPARLVSRLTDVEREWFGGTRIGYSRQYSCRRVELNAFNGPALIAYIESGLKANGAPGKVIPPRSVLRREERDFLDGIVEERVRDALAELTGIDEIVRDVRRIVRRRGRSLRPADVEARFDGEPELSWRRVAAESSARRIAASRVDIDRLVRRALAGRLLAAQPPGREARQR